MSCGLNIDVLANFRRQFAEDPKNQLAQMVCVRHELLDVLRDPKSELTPHVFNYKIEAEGKPVTDQKSSGRCWIFALLNCMRLPVMKQLKIEEFELSPNHLFFWDKIERMHYLLNVFVETARKGEPVDGRLVQHLLKDAAGDGGQYQMLINLIEKYGVMPKKCFSEAWSSENSHRLCLIINNKMREYCKILRQMVDDKQTDEQISEEILRMTGEVYRIVSICLGTPPESFTWQFCDKEKQYQKIGPITPVEFYEQYIKPYFNVADKIVIVNDPRPNNAYDRLYTVEYLNNMYKSPHVLYINQPADVLKRLAFESIKSKEPVWFGCDVNKHCSWKKFGLEDLSLFKYDLVFGVGVHGLNKAERLIYGDSLMTHAMVLTAVHEEEGKTVRWRIENSWSENGGDKGYMVMTDDWFTEYVLEVVVDKKFLTPEILDILKMQPTVLPAWDPMGALAGYRCHCGYTEQLPSQL